MKLLIIIPAYNEEQIIGQVLKLLPRKIRGINKLDRIVIDDGSTDKTAEIARENNTKVLSHMINRGLGGALGTGLEYARINSFDIAVTFDADGQHNPSDIKKVIQPILKNKADIVIGSRLKNKKGMPWYRVLGNFLLNIITYIFFGLWSTDTQSGLRAFSHKAIEKIQIETNRMEVSSEIINKIKKNRLKYAEAPIQTIYTSYSLKKGQKNSNGIAILAKLILEKILN